MSTIRTFRAATAREALAMVRSSFGEDAVILGHREIRRRRFPWCRTTLETELTAGIGADPPLQQDAGITAMDCEDVQEDVGACRSTEQVPSVVRSATSGTEATLDVEETPFRDAFSLYTHLIEQDVDEEDAREIVAAWNVSPGRPELSDQERFGAVAGEFLGCCGAIQLTPGRRRVVALVGPTGVGKTTTIAKLAANFRLRDRMKVAFITVDTFRTAAVEQLRTYAELIGMPMQVVSSSREMRSAVDEFAEMDLVLIDTAGRSPRDDLKIQELRSFLQAAQTDEVHLVLSLTGSRRSLSLAAETFRRVQPTAVILTKLDEAPAAGTLLSASRRADLPVSYWTTGQNVPDDIEAARADRAADWLVDGRLPFR